MHAGAHQFALEIIQRASKALGRPDNSGLLRAVEQAVRLLELIARVGACPPLSASFSITSTISDGDLLPIAPVVCADENRTPLTRLGASRHVKVVYNGVDVTTQPGLLVLCERAVAAIEGT
jgi:hypothetical protein